MSHNPECSKTLIPTWLQTLFVKEKQRMHIMPGDSLSEYTFIITSKNIEDFGNIFLQNFKSLQKKIFLE